ncbi:MAG: pyruvate formate-lyase-activating protein [Defluviitaleaceae bacterium]|nr:pyruvate formate-lyase-activating protein [Defluviitaleaceae bacterium]
MTYNSELTGFVHSVETAGMVDGPGVRYVVFLSGCSLRCKYCHNPDTWKVNSGTKMTIGELIKDIKKYRSYMTFSGGGVTITGGEPFVQSDFLVELLTACKANGFHTTLDTSGYTDIATAEQALKQTDLLLLDIKSFNAETYKQLTGVELAKTLDVLKLSEQLKIPVWVRFVLVPSHTDNLDDMRNMANFLQKLNNIQKIDVLPFHKMGEYKWQEIGKPYELANIQPPTAELLAVAKQILTL